MRARVLLDELDAAQATKGLFPVGPARQRRQELLRGIAEAQRRLMDPALAAGERAEVVRELERGEREEAALRAEVARSDARYAALRQPVLPSLAELRGALGEDEALVAFPVATRRNTDNRTTEDGSWAWVHTREGTWVHPIPDWDALRPAVSLFLGLVERRDGSEAEAAPVLYRDLLQRALEDLPPHVGSLWPLRDDEAERIVRGLYRYLAEGRSVAAALAAARRDELRARAPATAWAGLVVLGDGDVVPVPGGVRPRWPVGWISVALGAAALAGAAFLMRRRFARNAR